MDPLLVLFDIDGTLVDTAGAGRRAIERAFVETWRVDPANPRTERVRYAGMTDPAIFRALASVFGVGLPEYEAGAGRLLAAYFDALEYEMSRPDGGRRILPGVVELLDRLTEIDGLHLGLLTGNLERGARIKLEAFDLWRYFGGGGFGSDHEDRGRIARQAHRRMSARTGVDFPASRVVVVGDTEHDVACARVNGFVAVAVATGWIPRETLQRAGPDAVFSDLTDRCSVVAALGVG